MSVKVYIRIDIKLKKFFSGLFSLIVIVAIGVAIYFNQQFVKIQLNKVKGMYYVYKGDEAYRNLNLNKAIKLYNNALKLYPQHYSAWYNLGNIFVVYEDYYSALDAYSKAFKYNPKMMTARMNYGVVAAEKLGSFDIAIEQYNQIIKTKRKQLTIPYVFDNKESTKENKAIAYYNKGVTYRYKSLYEHDDWEKQRKYLAKAIDAYKKSLKISPKRYDTLFNLGIAYHVSGRYSEAGECYCKAIYSNPMSYEAHFNLAVLLRRLRHYKEAYEEIDKAATLITALGQNSSDEQYVSIVMNDITSSLYHDEGYRSYLKSELKKEKNNIKKKQTKSKEISSVNLVNGKVKISEENDAAIISSFAKCPSMHLFTEDIDE